MKDDKICVLLIEDDKVDQMAFKRTVEKQGLGYAYTIAGSASEASQFLKSNKYDIIVADYSLGDGTAFDVLKPNTVIPIVFVTGGGDEEIAVKAMKTGAYDYLIKDPDRNYLKVLPITIQNAIKYKRAEEALRESEEKYRTLTENINAGIYRNTPVPRGKFIEANPAIIEMFGYKDRSEFLGIPVSSLYENSSERKKFHQKMTTQGFVKNEVLLLKKKDGTSFWGSVTAVAVKDEKGKILYYDGLIEDITERKLAEKALRESEEMYRTLIRTSPDAVTMTNLEGEIIFASKKTLEIHGFNRLNQIMGKNAFDLIAPEDRERAGRNLQRTLQEGSIENTTYQLLRKDESRFTGELSAALIRDVDGSPVAFMATTRDITQRKQAEEKLKESEEKYRNLVDNAIVGIFKSNLKGEILYVNEAALRIGGYESYDELKRKNVLLLYKNPDARKLMLRELKNNGKLDEFELEILNTSGETRNVLMSASLSGDILSGMVLDITHRKQMEEEKNRIQAELLQAQKMEAVGLLAGGIAHDFNNILMTIQGCAEMATLDIDENHPLYEDLQQIRHSADRASDLTRQLLLFSRRHPMEFKHMNLNSTIINLLKMLKRIIGEDVTIDIEQEPDLWSVKADQGMIEQLILNIAINARDAMPQGGTLTIKTENEELEKPIQDTIFQIDMGKYVHLTIKDTGVGMEDDVAEHIFEPFYSTKAPGKGTGLGLSVVYGIVEQHKGGIRVVTAPGEGAEFHLFLPAIFSAVEEEDERLMPLDEYKGEGERILVVEDEEHVRNFTQKALHKYGYNVCTATDADEAMDIFEKEMGKFHLVLSDVVLPGKNGIELVTDLINRKPDLEVLLCSGYTDHRSQYPLIKERGYRFMQKPYDLGDMLRTVKQAVSGNPSICQS